ncbi:MAG TPA: YdeI/OmpD-associated family protein [Candidatus Eremiobacteraceae bacterium]|nr:YdeI/OmpD-associated family protein [Candidatus Eremiobacteraceae bacterium]
MKLATALQRKSPGAKSTVRFSTALGALKPTSKAGSRTSLLLPKNASGKLPSRSIVEGMLDGLPFRGSLAPTRGGRVSLRLSKAVCKVAKAEPGDVVAVEITRAGDERETRIPSDLSKALAANPKARAMWEAITPMARQNWILWLGSTKYAETRAGRIAKACDMLASGKRRVCCFGGLGWLTKDYRASGDTWLPVPFEKDGAQPKA